MRHPRQPPRPRTFRPSPPAPAGDPSPQDPSPSSPHHGCSPGSSLPAGPLAPQNPPPPPHPLLFQHPNWHPLPTALHLLPLLEESLPRRAWPAPPTEPRYVFPSARACSLWQWCRHCPSWMARRSTPCSARCTAASSPWGRPWHDAKSDWSIPAALGWAGTTYEFWHGACLPCPRHQCRHHSRHCHHHRRCCSKCRDPLRRSSSPPPPIPAFSSSPLPASADHALLSRHACRTPSQDSHFQWSQGRRETSPRRRRRRRPPTHLRPAEFLRGVAGSLPCAFPPWRCLRRHCS
mmetsp:Transcript_32212/g.68591  ORF Transcript_32212/g.68591 Transcript_32212/m.68591 type:complete len:291 (+) Transcript_32212:1970-2842(+)